MHRHANGLKTALLFGILWAVLLGIGALIAAATRSPSIIWIFAGVGVISTAVTYWNSDKIAIRAMHAYPVNAAQAPQLHAMVSELAAKAQLPMPRVYISPTSSPNAFATGRNPRNAAVCCTEGILELLSPRELRGVLGHELMHVKNRDILTSSVAAAMAGVLSSAGQMLFYFGGRGERSGIGGLLGSLLMAIVAPFIGMFLQAAISRTREYDADEDGAALTGDPDALADALSRIDRGIAARPMVPDRDMTNVNHLMIASPFRAGSLSRLFATHPPMADRIARLRSMR